MAQYITTGEELTSVANAIRAKTGENLPLTYPTEFVTDIGKLCKYDWKGENATLEWESNDITVSLADISISSWTPSTTSTIILNPTLCTSASLSLDATKYYIVVYECYSNLIYSSTPSVPYNIQDYYIGSYQFGCRPSTKNNFINDTNDMVAYAIGTSLIYTIYQTSSNSPGITSNNYGIYFTNDYPRLSDSYKNPFKCNLYTPYIRAVANNTYMHPDAFGLLDLNNSIIHIKVKLYSLSRSLMSSCFERFRELYDINNNIIT